MTGQKELMAAALGSASSPLVFRVTAEGLMILLHVAEEGLKGFLPSICPSAPCVVMSPGRELARFSAENPELWISWIIVSAIHVCVQLWLSRVTADAIVSARSAFLLTDWLVNSLPFKSQLKCHLYSSTFPNPCSVVITLLSWSL